MPYSKIILYSGHEGRTYNSAHEVHHKYARHQRNRANNRTQRYFISMQFCFGTYYHWLSFNILFLELVPPAEKVFNHRHYFAEPSI